MVGTETTFVTDAAGIKPHALRCASSVYLHPMRGSPWDVWNNTRCDDAFSSVARRVSIVLHFCLSLFFFYICCPNIFLAGVLFLYDLKYKMSSHNLIETASKQLKTTHA